MSDFNFKAVQIEKYKIEHGFIFSDLVNAAFDELDNWTSPILGQGFHINEIEKDKVINTFDVGLLAVFRNQDINYCFNNTWVIIKGYRYLCVDYDNNLYIFACIPKLNYSIGYKLDNIHKLAKDCQEELNREKYADVIALRNA